MNTETTPNTSVCEELDLLVDGELPEDRRARLLRALDGEPGGWKNCATAFLEAQAWTAAMGLAEVPRVRRRWPAPLAAIAAAILGFAAAVLFVPRGPGAGVAGPGDSPPAEGASRPAALPADLVALTDGEGRLCYTTRGDVPPFILRAVEDAGHRVEYHQRVVTIARDDGDPLELPLTETRILVNHSL